MKVCIKCNEEKELKEFGIAKQNKDGLRGQCKLCYANYKKEYGLKNKEKIKKYRENNKQKIHQIQKEYRLNNKDKLKEYQLKNKEIITKKTKEYYLNNKNKLKEYQEKYRLNNKDKKNKHYQENKETIIKKQKEYQLKNKEKINQYQEKYRLNNKDKLKKYRKEYRLNNKDKRNKHSIYIKLINPLYKLRCNIASLIFTSIKKQGYSKKSKTFEILGCTFEEFKVHLEKQFTKGMNWENQGKWHLDHIYPVSLAKDEEELIRLNHYTNFQPLWAEDNLKKGNKIIEKQLTLI